MVAHLVTENKWLCHEIQIKLVTTVNDKEASCKYYSISRNQNIKRILQQKTSSVESHVNTKGKKTNDI